MLYYTMYEVMRMRTNESGINWNMYYADSYEEAVEYFKEITGSFPNYDWLIQKEKDNRYSFRLHK